MTVSNEVELAPAIQSYLVYCRKSRRLSIHTCRAYESDLGIFERLASVKIANRESITATLKNMIERPHHKATTIGRRVIAVRGFLNWWNKGLMREVFSELNFRMKTPKRLPKTIPRNELEMLFAGARDVPSDFAGHDIYLILVLLASAGLRISELCSLRLLDVNAEIGELKVFGKGAKERIVVIANATIRHDLCQFINRYRNGISLTAPLFINKWGRAIDAKWVRARLKCLADLCGIRRKITPHMFRHTAATLLIEGGVDIRFVQRFLGHENLETTEIYTHVSDQALRMALERADVMQNFVAV
jgi:site-specific recombinase XerD